MFASARIVMMVLVAAGLTVASGMLHGRLSERWGPSTQMRTAGERLAELPERFGQWQRVETKTLTADTVDMLQCAGYISHVYAHEQTGQVVSVAVLLGPSGPISVHIPEICYSSRNYQLSKARQRVQIGTGGDAGDEFWTLSFRANDVHAGQLRVYYGWSTGAEWAAPEQPRFSYAGLPWLYKLQLACAVPPDTEIAAGDPGAEFLRDFLPVVRQHQMGMESGRRS